MRTKILRYLTFYSVLSFGLFFGLFLMTPSASAITVVDYLVEPYGAYSFLGNSATGPGVYTPLASTNTASFGGPALGARVGAQFISLIFITVDASYSPTLAVGMTTTGSHFGATGTAPIMTGGSNLKLGVTAGVNIPLIGIRGWLGWNPFDQLSGTSSTTLSGQSVKVGAGFKILPIVSINLEYILGVYSKFSSQAVASTVNPAGAITNQNFLASVSLPFNL